MSLRINALKTGCAALRAAGRATVFASFEHSFYVETNDGIACVGKDIGLGPLNILVDAFQPLAAGSVINIYVGGSKVWVPPLPTELGELPAQAIPESIREPAAAFLAWLGGSGRPDDALIGLGPGLTPAGDDFVGGAMIALRAFGQGALADRIAGWALPLAEHNTNRISRAHLECAAEGEGHEFLHGLLCSQNEEEARKYLALLARVGHTSGLDAAAGALRAIARNVTDRLQKA